eukprot:TRINITY_DN1391_c0_g1_i1.p1 TRINITY_DN1391_c0_g1~~TRINITY_DN1391_c0_g1_i1.p1  ORF type:complete len:299 (+),score=34.08 TRINITY_DN1391_c0_g1_i1:270-1166(+)
MPRPANAKNCKTCVICTGKWSARTYAKYRRTFAQLNPKRSTNPNCHLTEVQELFLINNCFDYEGKLSLFCYKHFIDFSGVGTKKYRKLKTAAGQRFENPRYQKQKRVRGANDSPGPLDLSGDNDDSDSVLNSLGGSGEKQGRKRKSNNNHDLDAMARIAGMQEAQDTDDEDDEQDKQMSGAIAASFYGMPHLGTAPNPLSMAHLPHISAQAMSANNMAARYNFPSLNPNTSTQSMSGDVSDVNQQLNINQMNSMGISQMNHQLNAMNQINQINQLNSMGQMNLNPMVNQTSLVGAQHL